MLRFRKEMYIIYKQIVLLIEITTKRISPSQSSIVSPSFLNQKRR
jgi:hypothetical protein